MIKLEYSSGWDYHIIGEIMFYITVNQDVFCHFELKLIVLLLTPIFLTRPRVIAGVSI